MPFLHEEKFISNKMHDLSDEMQFLPFFYSFTQTGELISEYKNLDELVADGWAVGE